jgi:hypothetical protein
VFEGLLLDFLQKNVLDKWVRRFLINSSYLFNERVIFDFFVKSYVDYLISSQSKLIIFTLHSVSILVLFMVSSLLCLFLAFDLIYLFYSL